MVVLESRDLRVLAFWSVIVSRYVVVCYTHTMAKVAPQPTQRFTHKLFGDKLRAWRSDVHLSQDDVAQSLGVTSGFIAHMETGRTLPSARKCESLADALGIPVMQVLHAAGHVSREYEPSDDQYLEPEMRLFFRDVWPRMSEDYQDVLKEFTSLLRQRMDSRKRATCVWFGNAKD